MPIYKYIREMNIGIFTDTYFPQINGVTYTISLWKDKIEKEDRNNVYIYYPKSSYTPKKNEFPFRSFEFRFYKGYRIAIPANISRKAKNLDVVHIHGLFSMAIAGIYVAKRHHTPLILTYHTPADEYIRYITKRKSLQIALMRIYNLWEKRILNFCDLITVPSQTIRERLLKKGIKDNVMVLSNGVDLNFFRRVDTGKFKTKYKIPDKECIIGFCGRLGYEKHLEDIIGISDRFKGTILIAGKGPAADYYKKMAEGKENVRFLGFLDRRELPELYSSLDIFVFPSTAETQGLVALEAMACGVPVVGANALALKDTIKDRETGYLYEQGNLSDLLDKIQKGYENMEILSENSLKHVQQHSIENTIEKLMEIYNRFV